MSLTIAKAVNFGPVKASLSTIGYTLKNYDGTTKAARATAGITEIVSATGMYGANIVFDAGWSGFIVWDTGDADLYYAIESYDERNFSGAGGVFPGAFGLDNSASKPSFSDAEKKKLFKSIAAILQAVTSSNASLGESIKTLQDKKIDFSEIKILIEAEFNRINSELISLKEKEIKFPELPNLVEPLKAIEDKYKEHNEKISAIVEGIESIVESQTVLSILKGEENENVTELKTED